MCCAGFQGCPSEPVWDLVQKVRVWVTYWCLSRSLFRDRISHNCCEHWTLPNQALIKSLAQSECVTGPTIQINLSDQFLLFLRLLSLADCLSDLLLSSLASLSDGWGCLFAVVFLLGELGDVEASLFAGTWFRGVCRERLHSVSLRERRWGWVPGLCLV